MCHVKCAICYVLTEQGLKFEFLNNQTSKSQFYTMHFPLLAMLAAWFQACQPTLVYIEISPQLMDGLKRNSEHSLSLKDGSY